MVNPQDRLADALKDRYVLERELGQGGMATVYLAEDLKHDRKVAIKVLKPELAAVLGAERFVQEIKTTAALQHPHILPLFDSGTAGQRDGGTEFLYYVMPYIEGETLRSRLDRERQLGIEEAVRITREVADALDYAHRNGVIHRDIKPENILLHDGRPMVADFGIALAVSAAAGGRMTETGLSLGTPHYMSPEQATAEKEITARSDVYSLASVLYEMLAGQPPHLGGTAQQIIMKIIAEPVAAVTSLRKSVPANVAAALTQALEKLPADRFDSARAFADALANVAFSSTTAAASGRRPTVPLSHRPTLLYAALALVAVLALALIGTVRSRGASPPAQTVRFAVTIATDSASAGQAAFLGSPVLSPDNRQLAIGILGATGVTIYLRALDAFDFRTIEGRHPFFSPSGRELGFFRQSEIWYQAIDEQQPTRVGEVPEVIWDIYGAAWHPDGRILAAGLRGLWALPVRGGAATLLLPADSTARERFAAVEVLDASRVLLIVGDAAGVHLEAVALDDGERTVIPGVGSGRVIGDVLVHSRNDQLYASRFDRRRLRPVGEPAALPAFPGRSSLGASVVWVEPEDQPRRELVWVSRDGRATPVGVTGRNLEWPRVSPDGRRIALFASGDDRIVVRNLSGGAAAPLSVGTEPVWSPDGARVYISTGNRPRGGIQAQVSDGSRGPDTLLVLDDGDSWPTSASPDGRWLAWYGTTLGSGSGADATDPNDVFFLDLDSREPRRVRLPGIQRGARFSPDGRWVAYQSTEDGRQAVHVRPFPAMDANYRVGDGTEPIFSRDGRELFYRRQSDVMVAPITVRGGTLEVGTSRVLFSGPFLAHSAGDISWDLAPDGRFLMSRTAAGSQLTVRVALNWITEVHARLDAANP